MSSPLEKGVERLQATDDGYGNQVYHVTKLIEICDDCYMKVGNGESLIAGITVSTANKAEPSFGKEPCDACQSRLAGNRWDAVMHWKQPSLWDEMLDAFTPFAIKCECKGEEASCKRALDDPRTWAQYDTAKRIAVWLRNRHVMIPPF